MAGMNFIRFRNILCIAIVDREKENFYNEGCSDTGISLIL